MQGGRRDRTRRPALFPAHRGRNAARRSEQGQASVGLDTEDKLAGSRARDGGSRLHQRQARQSGQERWIPSLRLPRMKITVIGTGYVGLVTGACLADVGNDVMCLDMDAGKIATLEAGGIPIHE